MMKLETPIGEFTTDSYKIPAEDTLAVSPAIISFSSDDYKIITIDQFIQISTDVYTPLLHQNCMSPDQKRVIGQNVLMANPSHQTFYPHYVSRSKQLHHPRLKDSFPIDSSHSFADK